MSNKIYKTGIYARLSREDENPDWEMAGIFADGPVKIGLNQKHPTARGALV